MKKGDIKSYFTRKVGSDFLDVFSHAKNYVTAELLSKGLAFISLPIFTRLLTPDEYGVMSVFISLVTVLSIVVSLGLRGAVSRYYYEPHNDFFNFYSSSFWFVTFSGIAFIVLIILSKNFLKSFLNIPLGMIYFSMFIVIPQALFELYQSYLQAAKKSKKVAILNGGNALAVTILSIAIMFILKEERYYGKAIAQLVVICFILAIIIYRIKDHLTFRVEKEHVKYALIFGLPIVLHLLSNYILTTFDQIIINNLVGKTETGFYSIAYRIGMMQSIISAGILKAWTPLFYERMNKREYIAIDILVKKYSYFVLFIALLLIFFSKEAINILVDKSYREALYIIPIIIGAYYFSFGYTIYVNYAFYEKKTKNIALFTIIAGALNILLNYLLIPELGYKVAAYTTLISFFILFLLHYINVKYFIKIYNLVSIKTFFLPTLLLILIVLTYFLITELQLNYWYSLIIRIIIVGILSLIYFKNIKKLNINQTDKE